MRNHITELEHAPAVGAQHLPLVTVTGVMVRDPKKLPATASLDDAATELHDDHVHLVLLVDGARLVGTVERDDLPDGQVAAGARAVDFATLGGRTVQSVAAAHDAMALMRINSIRRLAVVDGDDRLLGLLCLKRTGRGFCSDDDVASRRPHTHHDD
ncbi:MAG TPA: CBS domain-containing protein [Nocardioides sp.]